jgi:hypothetical protein
MRHYSTRAYFVITLCHAFRHILILLIYVIYKHDRKLQVIRKAAHAGTNWFYHLQLFNLLYHENWVKRVSLWGNKQTFLLYMNPSCKHAYWQQNLVYFALIHYAPTHHFAIITYRHAIICSYANVTNIESKSSWIEPSCDLYVTRHIAIKYQATYFSILIVLCQHHPRSITWK